MRTQHPVIIWQKHSFFLSLCSFIVWLLLFFRTNPFLTSKYISLLSFSLSLNTQLAPTNTMVKNTVVMYHWFTQRHKSEINGPLRAVAAAWRAVSIKSFGMVKVQCDHRVMAGKQWYKWTVSVRLSWNELNEMQSREWVHTCCDRPVGLRALKWQLRETWVQTRLLKLLAINSQNGNLQHIHLCGYVVVTLLYVFTLGKHIAYYSHSIHIT